MIRKAPATCLAAVLALLAAPLAAQDQSSGSDNSGDAQSSTDAQSNSQGMIAASDIEDATILAIGGNYDAAAWESEAPLDTIFADLEEVGEVEDVVLDTSGQVQGLTTDIGGFIGIGRKTIMLPLSDIRLAQTSEDGEITVITRLDRQTLEDAPSFSLDD